VDPLVTSFGGFGAIPIPATPSGPAALAHATTDFWRSAAFGLILLALLWVYMTKRIL
jgi:hypothetical protein